MAIKPILKEIDMKYLMNTVTGSVDTLDNWAAEMFTWDDDPAECQRQFNALIEVILDDHGGWITP